MQAAVVSAQILEHWSPSVDVRRDRRDRWYEVETRSQTLEPLCSWIVHTLGYVFAGLVVEQQPEEWLLRYLFHATTAESVWVHVIARRALSRPRFPSISAAVHAADWHEREAEDLFGLEFEGHPQLGDFVLHDDVWQEGLAPMRREFDARQEVPARRPDPLWRPPRIVHAPGAFSMPIGPVYSGAAESAHFLLETVGEDVIRALPRLFYKYRAVEKIAEGRRVEDVLLLAERLNGLTAFAHGTAFAQAIEAIGCVEVPPRAQILRTYLAELERLRHHVGAIQEICESTALVVASSQAAILEEELLRLCGALTGHRYLFGLTAPGGMSRDFADAELHDALGRASAILQRLLELESRLRTTSSFLDRLEEVGIVSEAEARTYGLVGPIARASGVAQDLRQILPYAHYAHCHFVVPKEAEGDGYARLRVLFADAQQSLQLMEQAFAHLHGGPVRAAGAIPVAGAALGWTETPLGAGFHWLRTDDRGMVLRYRAIPPSFVNWHAFHLAAEKFAFQDFPIILASFGLSVTENDR
jgi:formate hydrogenlyase subunit 5